MASLLGAAYLIHLGFSQARNLILQSLFTIESRRVIARFAIEDFSLAIKEEKAPSLTITGFSSERNFATTFRVLYVVG